jgi:hypothetical protein
MMLVGSCGLVPISWLANFSLSHLDYLATRSIPLNMLNGIACNINHMWALNVLELCYIKGMHKHCHEMPIRDAPNWRVKL